MSVLNNVLVELRLFMEIELIERERRSETDSLQNEIFNGDFLFLQKAHQLCAKIKQRVKE